MSDDLFGDEYADLLQEKNGKVTLSNEAKKYISLTSGAIFIWPESLQEEIDGGGFAPQVEREQAKIKRWEKRETRLGDPIESFFEALFVRYKESDIERLEQSDYVYSTLGTVETVLADSSVEARRDALYRMIAQLVEFGYLNLIAEHRGNVPKMYEIVYPFKAMPSENSEPVTVVRSQNTSDVYIPELPPDDSAQAVLDIRRQIAHWGRPHTLTDVDGNPRRSYKSDKTAIVPDEQRRPRKMRFSSTVRDNSPMGVSVMEKLDDGRFAMLFDWCVRVQRVHKGKFGTFLDRYYIEDKDLAQHVFNYAPGSVQKMLPEMRLFMWRLMETTLQGYVIIDQKGEAIGSTTVGSDVVTHVNEDGTEEVHRIKSTSTRIEISQFKSSQPVEDDLSNGEKRLRGMYFQLHDNDEADVRRRAINQKEGEEMFVEGSKLPARIQMTQGPSFKDSLAYTLRAFYQHEVHRRKHPYINSLNAGLEHIFDVSFSVDPAIKGPERTRQKNRQNGEFRTLFTNFCKVATDDWKAALNVWNGTQGGVIRSNASFEQSEGYYVKILIDPRKSKTTRKTGSVEVFSTARLAKQPKNAVSALPPALASQDQSEGLLIEHEVHKLAAKSLAMEHSGDRILEVVTYVMQQISQGKQIKNKGAYITKLLASGADVSGSPVTASPRQKYSQANSPLYDPEIDDCDDNNSVIDGELV